MEENQMLNYFTMLAGETATKTPGGDLLFTLVMIAGMVAIFYFMAIRPQKKQEKEALNMRNSLQVGDEITTIGGIIGRVVSIKDETLVLETTRDCTKIRILKSAVRSIDVKAEDAQ
jgi:preprotein translocase subunit YajC